MKSNTLSWSDLFSLQKIVEIIFQNKVVLAPSDTVWGLCGTPTKEVFESLNMLKVRNDKPYLLLARSIEDIEQYAYLPEDLCARALIESFWPGPLTVIFKAREGTPHYMIGQNGTIAFRVPSHEVLERILKQVPVLFSTSANVSGQPVPLTYIDVAPSIKDAVALAVISETDEMQSNIPSTIIDLSQGSPFLVREGAIAWDVLQLFLKR